MKKYIVLIMVTSFLGTGCKKKYEEGFNAGLADGVAQGRIDGYEDGYSNGNIEGSSTGFDTGYADGHSDGFALGRSEGDSYYLAAGYNEGSNDGYDYGLSAGTTDGFNHGYDNGYNEAYDPAYAIGHVDGDDDGYADGYTDGYNSGDSTGYNVGYNNGYNANYDDGSHDGYYSAYWSNAGYSSGYNAGDDDGYDDGYDNGYDDGYDDGWDDYEFGSSAGSKNPQVKLAAMVNQDLFNFSHMKKFNSKKMISSMSLSHSDSGTVDMEKLAALKEQHYLNQMKEQLMAKFGLNNERSAQIAKVSHQFNKLAGSRELTEKDANSFAKEVIGHNLKDIESAIKKSLKGDSTLLNDLVTDIADHNETNSENVNAMISSIFF